MKSIIEQLCKGEVEYVSLKLPKDRLEKEMSYYDKIKALMTGENAVLFDEYADTVALNYEFLILRAYTLAFKTGFLLGLEMADTEVDLCQYFGQKKLKYYADFFSSSSSLCCGVI